MHLLKVCAYKKGAPNNPSLRYVLLHVHAMVMHNDLIILFSSCHVHVGISNLLV